MKDMKNWFARAACALAVAALGCEEKSAAPSMSASEAATEASAAPPTGASEASAAAEPEAFVPVVGVTTPEQVRARHANWATKYAAASADREASEALAGVEPGAEVTIVFGTWCSDCYRELPRIWKALEGIDPLPFSVRYIAVDEQLGAPGVDELGSLAIEKIPTVIVRRDGAEVGRLIERSDRPFEVELAALLGGEKSGVVSASPAVSEEVRAR